MTRFLITGTAGFIGYHLAARLLADGHVVTGFDGMTPYYDVALKRRRHELLARHPDFTAMEAMLEDRPALSRAFEAAAPDVVVHLAAQAGVRHSIRHPEIYASANLIGTMNVIELCRAASPRHLLLASTSSVYGMESREIFEETDTTDRPISLYAATKKAGEVMAHSYAHLYAVPTTVCRFFTVYGPNGRPDMALFKFVRAILADEPIDVFGEGRHERDFTYIDDLVEAVVRLIERPPVAGEPVSTADTLSAVAPYREVNIAGGRTVGLMRYIEVIEEALGRKARLNLLPMQPGDVARTAGSPKLLEALTGYRPSTPVEIGVPRFVDWYLAEYAQRGDAGA